MTRRTETEHDATSGDRGLWRRYRENRQVRPALGEIDDGLIAAYLDGGLGTSEREAVEDWLAANPEAFETLVAAREIIREGGRPRVPDAVLARAKALTQDAPQAPPQMAARRPAGPRVPFLRNLVEWSAAAAAIIVACVVGFEFGLQSVAPTPELEIALGETPAVEMWAPAEGLLDLTGSDVFDPSAFVNGDAS